MSLLRHASQPYTSNAVGIPHRPQTGGSMRVSTSKHERHKTSLARRVHPTQLCGWVPGDKKALRFGALLSPERAEPSLKLTLGT
jgi:hypothetical protein